VPNQLEYIIETSEVVGRAIRAMKTFGMNGLSGDQEEDMIELQSLQKRLEKATNELAEIYDLRDASNSVFSTISQFSDQFGSKFNPEQETRNQKILDDLDQKAEKIIQDSCPTATNALAYAVQILSNVVLLK
jgi:hypothetical protein